MATLVEQKSHSTLAKLNQRKSDLSPSNDFIVPLGESNKGYSREFTIGAPRPELTNQWRTTLYAIPKSQNPLNLANEGVIDDIQQPGEVHFLAGVFSPPPGKTEVTRKVKVASDQSIVLPILTAGADNVWGDDFASAFPDAPVPYQFPIDELRAMNKAFIDTATEVSLKVNDKLLVSDANRDKYRVASSSPYTLNLPPEDDLLGYRANYPPELIQPPYTQGVQDGFWVELKNLPLGRNTIHFKGTINYGNIDEMYLDYNKSGTTGDTPLEYVLNLYKNYMGATSLDITYNVNVLPRPAFNAQLRG